MEIIPGSPTPLGPTPDAEGCNFALFSEVAERVELCLFDGAGREERLELPERDGFTWHGYVPGLSAGQRYGYRVHGPWDPAAGMRCNPAKLLIDPYARATTGEFRWGQELFSYQFGAPEEVDTTDSAEAMPKSLVVDSTFDWDDDIHPERPLTDTIIYEAHVRGLTARHPQVSAALRGTYAGVAQPAVVQHLVDLGITAIELMPVHQFVHDAHLVERGLSNYWGYNSVGFFAPHQAYASESSDGAHIREFKEMVKALHAAGIEVILDVVYNHTAEGNHLGPTLSMKGIDNGSYYRLVEDSKEHYFDYTGTGNTLNTRHPNVLQLIMDSLRYWIEEMHVDGFRFDLASALARELHEVDRLSSFFDIIQQDPVINRVKLIAEPWDVGEGGYQVGNFPPLWSEWNGHYRDEVRDFWRGEPGTVAELASRLAGSSDLYASDGRKPHASINFVTAHDGFTLRDLVSYNEKHNEANGEDNQDGESHNRSWNCGAEGETDDREVNALRARQQRNFLATLFFSQGVPMLLAGDELGRTQQGNNNAYCQDNEISWLDWENVDDSLLAFTRRVIGLRNEYPAFRTRRWLKGEPHEPGAPADILWFRPDGVEMDDSDWDTGFARALTVFLSGRDDAEVSAESAHEEALFLLLNAHDEPIVFTLPSVPGAPGSWAVALDTGNQDGGPEEPVPTQDITVAGRGLVLLRRADGPPNGDA